MKKNMRFSMRVGTILVVVCSSLAFGTESEDMATHLKNAILQQDRETVEKLLQTNIDIKDERNMTPLMYAAGLGYYDVVDLLLWAGADINKKEITSGLTPLILAVQNENRDVVELLLQKGADVNMTNNKGRTPISIAAERGNRKIVESLLLGDAKSINDALFYALVRKDKEIIKLLMKAGAKYDTFLPNPTLQEALEELRKEWDPHQLFMREIGS